MKARNIDKRSHFTAGVLTPAVTKGGARTLWKPHITVPRRNRRGSTSNKPDVKWNRVCRRILTDSVYVRVPRAFLPTLTLFFHHVSDAMAGDDRPDHGLAKMRQGREHYQMPFYFIYGKLRRAEKRMSRSVLRKSLELFHRYLELSEDQKVRFREKLIRGSTRPGGPVRSS